MEPSEKIAVRLAPETIVALKVIVDRGESESMSDAVRQAVEEFVLSRFTREEISLMTPEIQIEYGDSEPVEGSSVEAMNKAIHDAVTGFMRAKMESTGDDESKEDEDSKTGKDERSESE